MFVSDCSYFISKKAHEGISGYGYWNTWLNRTVALSQPGHGSGKKSRIVLISSISDSSTVQFHILVSVSVIRALMHSKYYTFSTEVYD